MFCKKCGRRIEEGDAFCPYCGEPIPKEEIVSRRTSSAAHNPEFHWNVKDEFPEPKKRETMEFNWTSGEMTPRRAQQPVSEPPKPVKPVETDWTIPEEKPARPAATPKEPEIPSWLAPKEGQELPRWIFDELSPKEEPKPAGPAEPSIFEKSSLEAFREAYRRPSAKPTAELYIPKEPAEPEPYANAPQSSGPYAPETEPRRTESFVPQAEPRRESPFVPQTDAAAFEPEERESVLERRIRDDVRSAEETAWTRREEKFYTFTQKNEEFQKLLDREYEKIRRNGTPPERPIPAAEEPVRIPETPRREAIKTPEPAPAEFIPTQAPQNVRTEAPKTQAVPQEPPKPVSPVIPAAAAAAVLTPDEPEASQEPTIRISHPGEPIPERPAVSQPESAAEASVPKAACAEPTLALTPGPEEIRTIWEEIKADMERENKARAAEAAAAPDAKKPKAEMPEDPAVSRRRAREALSPTATQPRATGEVEAVTATALTKIWQTEEEEEEIPEKKGHFWLILFLILVVILLAVIADLALQRFWPDTGAAAFAKDAEDWVLGVWEDVKALFAK